VDDALTRAIVGDIWKEVTLLTLLPPRIFWHSSVGGQKGQKGHIKTKYNNYMVVKAFVKHFRNRLFIER
jgi:hypothetical protein